ncbi:XdhC family protein [Paraburkholderia youngii]|uniref:XdhC family protein n=1 Tax=Paraburkholderia youngii TaxID=2782701 RepID=UPI003D19EA32
MDSVDVEVLRAAISWHQNRMPVIMATVIRTWGSAPRPVGSLLALRLDGLIKGSVSGGCIEDDLVRQAKDGRLDFQRIQTVKYGVSAEEAHRFGLPCGGTLELVLEPLNKDSKLNEVFTAILSGQTLLRTLDTLTGKARLSSGDTPGRTFYDGRYLQAAYGPQLRVVLIGAGQLSEYVARIALPLGYSVIVCDPRDEYSESWDVADIEVSREMPDDLLIRLKVDSNTAVVALTHDPKLDDMALLEALKSDAFYVGAVGSRSNSGRRKERLKLFDLSSSEVDRLHAPVGLHIGAQTPPEIAVAILAEMTAVRRNVPVVQTHAARNRSDSTSVCKVELWDEVLP